MASDRGRTEHRGRYLEIERPALLRFTWISTATEDAETIVTVTFETVEDGTRVLLVHVGLSDAAAERHERGWESILLKMPFDLLPPTFGTGDCSRTTR